MSKEKLLVVDDMSGMRHLMGSIATKAGFSVETAGNAIDFKKIFESFQPSVIVLDLLIPDEDGIELLWYLHRQGFTGAIVIISGASKTINMAAQAMATGLRLCVAGSFTKPFNVQKLRDCLLRLRGELTDKTA
jgi:DNA-binding NtrC family response regulator